MQTLENSDRTARIKRIRQRGCPEIIQALEHGECGIKTLERLSRLPIAEQSRARRLRRIARRATAELQSAYNEGRLSLRAYDRLSKLSPARQREMIRSDRDREQAQNLAALTIRTVLAHKEQRIDLGLIAAAIIASIRST